MSEFWVKKMKRYFHMLDIDGDGVLTQRDYEMLGERFAEKGKLDAVRQEQLVKCLNKIWRGFTKLASAGSLSVTESVFIESLKTLRKDKEFKVTLIEASRKFLEVFDTNEDGFLQEDEFRVFFESVGFADVGSYAKIAFDAIDTNHDGKLSTDEMNAAFADFVTSEDEKSPSKFFFGPLE